RQASPSGSRRIPCATVSPPICSRAERICERSRRCWGTPTWPRRSSTPTWTGTTFAACTGSFILEPEQILRAFGAQDDTLAPRNKKKEKPLLFSGAPRLVILSERAGRARSEGSCDYRLRGRSLQDALRARQLRLFYLQPRPVVRRAGARAGSIPQRRAHRRSGPRAQADRGGAVARTLHPQRRGD